MHTRNLRIRRHGRVWRAQFQGQGWRRCGRSLEGRAQCGEVNRCAAKSDVCRWGMVRIIIIATFASIFKSNDLPSRTDFEAQNR